MLAQPQAEHNWLQKLIGEWTTEMRASMGPGEPPQTFRGRERGRSLGGLWVLCEGEGDTPGGGTSGHVMTLGYDPNRGKYVGTFIHSMGAYLWVYDGSVDSSGRKLVLDAEGPSFTDNSRMAKYKDTIEFQSDDLRLLRSSILGDDGQWTEFMQVEYRRVS